MAGENGFTNALVDTKVVIKPGLFKSTMEEWPDWRFAMENYAACLHPALGAELDGAAQETDAITIPHGDEGLSMRYRSMYTILSSLVQGKAREMAKRLRGSKNGFELWRLLVAEFEPSTDSRKLAMLSSLLDAKELDNLTQETFEEGLMRWEAKVREYESISGKQLDDDHRRAIMLKKAPSEIRKHMQVNAAGFTSYAMMKDSVQAFLTASRTWSIDEPVPMEVGAMKGKGKDGKGRGKDGKGKGKDGKGTKDYAGKGKADSWKGAGKDGKAGGKSGYYQGHSSPSSSW